MKKQFGILAVATLALWGITATSAQAYDVTVLRDSPAADAPSALQSNGFHFVGTYDEIDNQWKMWFNRSTGECVGYTQKGRKVSRAKPFKNDRCREAERGGYGGRHDRYDNDRYDNDRHDNDRYHGDDYRGDRDVPRWMVGYFLGYSRILGSTMSLNISSDGQVVATLDGRSGNGELRRGKLRIGTAWYSVDRDDNGFTTREIGNERNVVHYRRR
jgi:hypothetical protein